MRGPKCLCLYGESKALVGEVTQCNRSRYQAWSPWQRASACGRELGDQLLSPRCFPFTDAYL
jgi:hypothetical protein